MKLSNYSLSEIMEFPLPPVYIQKKLPYRPTKSDVRHVYNEINYHIFDHKLRTPKLILASHCKKYWGMCIADNIVNYTGSYCRIRMMDKWFCPQWFITTLAHEMVHQYQWDVLGPIREEQGKDWLMSHGPSFYQFKPHLHDHNISLKTAHSQRRWFIHQDLFKA